MNQGGKRKAFPQLHFLRITSIQANWRRKTSNRGGEPGRFQRKGHIKVTRQHLCNETENDTFWSLKGNKIKPQGVGNKISVCFHLLLGLSFLHSDQAWTNGLLWLMTWIKRGGQDFPSVCHRLDAAWTGPSQGKGSTSNTLPVHKEHETGQGINR